MLGVGRNIQRKHSLKEIIQRSGQVSLGVQQARTVLPADCSGMRACAAPGPARPHWDGQIPAQALGKVRKASLQPGEHQPTPEESPPTSQTLKARPERSKLLPKAKRRKIHRNADLCCAQ